MRLEAKQISFRYGANGRQILENVSFSVESGERVGIMAPSGFGKTTLLKILSGYERPSFGEVLWDGKPVSSYQGYCPVQMIWQHPELSVNPRRRLRSVIDEGDWESKVRRDDKERGGDKERGDDKERWGSKEREDDKERWAGNENWDGPAERERIIRALGIEEDWLTRFPQEVSGGELQRFCIARALGGGTRAILADEITTMLDLVTQAQLWSFLRRETEARGITLIAVSHSPELLEKVCGRIIKLA